MRHIQQTAKSDARRGAVAVEFAVMAPFLIVVMLGLIEVSRTFEVTNQLEVAAREGARFAAMDRDGMLQAGQSSNDKLVNDVLNILSCNGVPRDAIVVEVKDYENPANDFNLDDPANDLRLFEVLVSVNYSDVSMMPVAAADDYQLAASVVFRNGRATLAE